MPFENEDMADHLQQIDSSIKDKKFLLGSIILLGLLKSSLFC